MSKLQVIVYTLFCFLSLSSYAQKQKNRFPIWTFHVDSTNVHGLSIGAFSMYDHPHAHLTNGVKLEAIGVGLGIPLIPQSPIARDSAHLQSMLNEPYSEKVNGFSLSVSGAANHSRVNGFLIGGMGQISTRVNGLAICGMLNFVQITNGIMISGANGAFFVRGVQVGAFNRGNYIKGLQLGFFNTVIAGNGVQIGGGNMSEEFNGLQIGLGNETEVSSGVQIAVYNKTISHKGVQIGVFNSCREHKGIQIGLWNVNQRRRLPLVNWNFR